MITRRERLIHVAEWKNGRLFVFATPATFFIITNTIIFIVMYSIVVFGFEQKLKKEFYKCISFKIFNRSSSIGFVMA